MSLHGVPLEINSERGSLFTSRFWESFQNAMGTRLSFSTAFQPQSSGQVERVNQILEDMLRASVISFGMDWENAFHSPSSLITIVIKLAWAKLLSKFSMDENVERLLTGQKLGKDNSLAQI